MHHCCLDKPTSRYGHKSRELLMLACSQIQFILTAEDGGDYLYTTYVKSGKPA